MTVLTDEVARLTKFAEDHQSPYAYTFYETHHFGDDPRVSDVKNGELIEVRAHPGGAWTLTACDRAGRPIDQPKPAYPDNQPFIRNGAGVSQPVPRTIRDEIREEEQARIEKELAAKAPAIAEVVAEAVEAPTEEVEEAVEEALPVEKSAWRKFWGY